MPVEDNEFYKSILDNLSDGVYFVDPDRTITYWNKGAEHLTGYAGEQVIGRHCRDNLLNHVTANGTQLCLSGCPLAACMEDGNPREAEVFLHHADGHRVPVTVRASPMRDSDGRIVGAVETFNSNTGLIDARQQLRELHRHSQTDGLTGIVNRVHLDGLLRASVVERTPAQAATGLLFIDIDRFKLVNDTHGHVTGDAALRMVAATLQHNLRALDEVGRWGGEEFLVILPEMPSTGALRAVAEKLRTLVAASSLDVGDQQVRLTISVGATLLLPDDESDTFVHRADTLMYASKRAGGDRVTLG